MYLLDTNFYIEILNRKDSNAAKKLTSVNPGSIRLCAVVKAELFHEPTKADAKRISIWSGTFAICLQAFRLMTARRKSTGRFGVNWKNRES